MRRRELEAPDLHPAALRRAVRRRDIAYAGYLFFGLALAIAFALNWIPTDWWLYGIVARGFGFPVLVASWPVAGLALGFSVTVWREWPLWIPAAFVVGSPWLLAWPPAPAGGIDWLGLYFVAFTLAALALPLWWLVVERRRLLGRGRPF